MTAALLFGYLQVRVLGDESNIFKYLQRDSSKWEVARPPNEVSSNHNCQQITATAHLTVCYVHTASAMFCIYTANCVC